MTSINVVNKGTPWNSELGANAGLINFIKTTGSSQLMWLHIIVDVYFK